MTKAAAPASFPASALGSASPASRQWEGPTYYGRSQLKAAPFNVWVVGAYVFLAGLSGSSALISAVADMTRGPSAAGTVRRGRYLSLLAPTIGSLLLICDLHTPKRFYNMMRVVKGTSPMSIGTWTLLSFSLCAGLTGAAQAVADWFPRMRWLRRVARTSQIPAAAAGAGLSTYTAALLSATSTPLWAAAPRATAVRFGASSMAAGASALALGERQPRMRRNLDALAVAALAAELASMSASHEAYRRKHVEAALDSNYGRAERYVATGIGILMPLMLHGLFTLSIRDRRHPASNVARLAALGGSMALRVSLMGAGNLSAERPDISFHFTQPENLDSARR